MLYFWILTVILFALPVGLVMLTWDRSQADARECVIRWQIIASALYFLATGPTSQGGETALLMMLLGALIAATALLVVLVQILQTAGTKLAVKYDKRIQK
mgnify:CR=1 FL=1